MVLLVAYVAVQNVHTLATEDMTVALREPHQMLTVTAGRSVAVRLWSQEMTCLV